MADKKTRFRYRGLAVIIVNKSFTDVEMKRRGATKDLEMMKNLFLMLDFKVKAYLNKSSGDMIKVLEKAKTWKFDYKPECFVCVVSTHGAEVEHKGKGKGKADTWKQSVYGTDDVPVGVEDIINTFTDSKCEAYSGKPKLFFIQACRIRFPPTVIDKYGKVIPPTGEDRYDKGLEVLVQKVVRDGDGGHGPGDSNDSVGTQDSADGMSPTEAGSQIDKDIDIKELKEMYHSEDVSDDEWDGQLSDEEEDDEDDTEPEQRDSKSQAEQAVTAPFDESNAKGSESQAGTDESDAKPKTAGASGDMRPVPTEVVALEMPQNCLLMVPVMKGKAAFRNGVYGSWMLHYMYKNRQMLLNKSSLLQYLTKICGEISDYEYNVPRGTKAYDKLSPEVRAMLPCKMCACVMHRLMEDIVLEPREKSSFMAVVIQKLSTMFQKIGIKA